MILLLTLLSLAGQGERNLEDILVNKRYLDAARQRDDLEILTDPRPLDFDHRENLLAIDQ